MTLNRTSRRISPSLFCLAVALATSPALAAEEVIGETDVVVEDGTVEEDTGIGGEILVLGTRLKGSVETDIPPTDTLSEADITAVGASSVADILAAIAPQTGSGRGRGSGPPVILLNGQRISNCAICRQRRSSKCRFSPKKSRCNMAFALTSAWSILS
jgi:iron complex outermembrane recepter protein